MKPDSRITKLAKLLVQYSVEVKENEKVSINGSTLAEPLLREIYKEILIAGAHPRVHMEFEDQKYLYYKFAKDFQLEFTDPFLFYEMENIDVSIHLFSGLNPHDLTSIDAEKKQKSTLAQKTIMDIAFKRWGSGDLRWVGSICPTPALAQEAHMAFDEYSEFVFSCMNLNDKNPVNYWKNFSKQQQKICDYLNQIKEMKYVGEDTELKFRCEGRKWINCDGKYNFPDGEVFTGPIEDSVEGTIRFTYPGIFQGEEIENIFLQFEKGKVIEAKAEKGENLLHKLLDTDENAKYVGEIAIGTNDNINRFTKNMLFDEKMGGTVHLAIGRGIPDSGSKNESAIHWDMLKNMQDGGEIYADDVLIYKNGKFLI